MRGMIKRVGMLGSLSAVLGGALWGCSAENNGPAQGDKPGALGTSSGALGVLQAQVPKARLKASGQSVERVYGAALAEGSTPDEAAARFISARAAVFNADPADLKPTPAQRGPATSSTVAPAPLGLMFDKATGQYRFYLYRYGQERGGLRVHGSTLLALVKNSGNNPVVWSASTLRGLGSFVAPQRVQAHAPSSGKALHALAARADLRGQKLGVPTAFSKLGAATPVIFAGTGPRAVPARLAFEYVAESTNPPGRWRFVTDATTDDVLDVEDLISFDAVNGTVAGVVTQGDTAMDCAEEATTAFPYAEVALTGGASSFADPLGAFTVPNAGVDPVTLQSLVGGQYFDVTDAAGSNEQLLATVTPPGPVTLLHNPANASDLLRAQVNGYVQANQIRDFLLGYLPGYPTISTQTNFAVSVNRTDLYCPGNAWYDGSSINFCTGSAAYGNTSFASVNHHEYGHHIVGSGGSGQAAYGEGMSDVIAMLYSGVPGLGYGFYLNQCTTPLRTADNDCQYSATACSSCGSEAHACGNLISGAVWDMRLAFAAAYPETYADMVNALVLSSIPMHTGTAIDDSIAIDLLTLDDDDADLDNGTPHYAQICAGFNAHGLTCPPIQIGLGLNGADLTNAEGPVGGPFAPTSVSYTVKNLGPSAVLAYDVSVAEPWLQVSNGQGQLDIGEQAQVTVTLDQAQAALLPKGVHEATIQFTNLTDGTGNTTRPLKLEVGAPSAIYQENFEGGLGGFSVDAGGVNLWHVTSSCVASQPGHTTPNSLYFGQDSTCNYDVGLTAGTVTSPAVLVSDTSLVKLRFNYYLDTENFSSYDRATAQVSVNGGAFATVASNKADGVALLDKSGAWQAADIDLTSLLAGLSSPTLRVRFGFDSVDSAVNQYSGFSVDDVQVRAFTQACTTNAQCDDGAFCNGVEQCSAGSCTPGTPVACDDGVACTLDSCNEATDACEHAPNNAVCDDGVACNGSESCGATGCQAGTPLNCNDNDACTTDSCNPATGCQNVALACDDGNACTSDSCNPASGCVYTNSTGACADDGDACTNDVCSGGACTHPSNGSCGGNAFVESGGLVSIEAEHYSATVSRASHSWSVAADGNASGGSLVTASPNNNTNINTGYTTGSPELDFQVQFTTTGTYYVWLRGSGATADDDSAHAGIDGTGPASADRISSFGSSLTWSKSTMDGPVATIVVSSPGIHTVNVWMREDGFRLDKLVLTTSSSYTPSGAGPTESAKGGGGGGCTSNAQCDDNNACTNDVCSGGACTHTNNTATCADDGNTCTNDVCAGGACTHPDNGTCGGSQPCTGLCTNPISFNQNFQSGNLGTAATCHQTTANLQGGNCGNFAAGRTLKVNGVTMTCNNGNWSSLPAKSNGGYCVQTTAGDFAWAYFTTW